MLPLLIDLDGVLRIGKNPANGVSEFLQFLKESKRPACIISNSTLYNSELIKKFFKDNNISIAIPIMAASDASYLYAKSNFKKVKVYCSDSVKIMFEDIDTNDNPEAVIVGDLGKSWTFDIINEIFLHVKNGAKLIAMQKNKFWNSPDDGYLIDAGAFINAIEFATGVASTLIGKPSPLYFQMGLKMLGLKSDSKFLMLGDDLETDIIGSQNLGSEATLIYTGKTEYPLSEKSKIKPNYEAKDLFEVISFFGTNLLIFIFVDEIFSFEIRIYV